MTQRQRDIGDPWAKGGTHQLDIARLRSPGLGHAMKRVRFCVKCGVDREPKGGHFVGSLFFCALHKEAS